MFTPITFPSALFFWLNYDNLHLLHTYNEKDLNKYFDTNVKQLILENSQAWNPSNRVHIMVPSSSLRQQGASFSCHVMPKNLPSGSFVSLTKSIQIISPELCFLLAANHLTVPELVVLANDLCGQYARNNQATFGQINRRPVTNVLKISGYLQMVKNVDGISKARTAIRYVLDGSNSPMESRMAAATTLRYYYGGYAISPPLLNGMAELSSDGATLLRRSHCCCDMLWPEEKVIVEYDSNLVHLNRNQFEYDKKKSSALNLSGYTVINATHDNFRNYNTIEEFFLLVKRSLGQRIRYPELDRNLKTRTEVINKLFLTYGALNWFSMFS